MNKTLFNIPYLSKEIIKYSDSYRIILFITLLTIIGQLFLCLNTCPFLLFFFSHTVTLPFLYVIRLAEEQK